MPFSYLLSTPPNYFVKSFYYLHLPLGLNIGVGLASDFSRSQFKYSLFVSLLSLYVNSVCFSLRQLCFFVLVLSMCHVSSFVSTVSYGNYFIASSALKKLVRYSCLLLTHTHAQTYKPNISLVLLTFIQVFKDSELVQ